MTLKIRRLFSLFVSLLFLIGNLNVVALAASSQPGYLVSGEASGEEFVLHVSLQNVRAMGGRLAISFDTDKLQLADTSSFTSAIKASSGITITQEGIDKSLLLSNFSGHVMFAWYATASYVNAASADRELVTIPFRLVNGFTADDFNRNTISLYYVNRTMVQTWDCSANIVTSDLVSYRNNAVDNSYLCAINYDYPHCDYIPIITYDVSVNVTTTGGIPISADVTLDNLEAATGSSGNASFQMEDGVYAYRISAPGYETKSGYFIINGSDETFNVRLMSYAELAASIADSLNIGYAEGDSSASVTSNVSLITTSEYGNITWQSSNSNIVDNYGIVTRGEDDARATLTATVHVGTATERRSFDVTVKSRLTAEEKNAGIVAQDKAALDITYSPGDSQNSVTAKMTLAEVGEYGSSIMWRSDNENIVDSYGAVERPVEDTQVKLTAYIIRGSAQDKKEFTVTVKGVGRKTASDAEIVKTVANAVDISFADGDSEGSVTNSLTLPQVGAEDTYIEWTSSDPAVITAYGGVVRQANDVTVTLTATIYKGSESATKTFTVLVKAAETTPVNPNNGQEEEIRQSAGSDASGATISITDGGQTPRPTAAPTETASPTPAPIANNNDRFTDITSVPWAREAILTLAERGVISGTSDTTYSPQNNIRRADFITLLMRMLDLDGEITETFADVPRDKYYYESVSLAKSLGIIAGIDETHFNPEGSITRQDMMTMTYRALTALDMADMTAADLSAFKDWELVSDYAYESVSRLVGGGYIHGDDAGNINPKSNTTRAETAVFLYQLGI